MITESRAEVIEAIATLPDTDFEELKQYVGFLLWRSKQQSEPKSDAKRILEATNRSHDVKMEDAEALLESIAMAGHLNQGK